MSNIKAHKIFVRSDDTAVITCCNCRRQKILPVSTYKGKKSQVTVKCGCKNVFTVEFEFRNKFRKTTNLDGKFINHSRKISGDINVKNLSLDGVGFTTKDIAKLKIGDKIEVSFQLDNSDKAIINKDAVVKNIRNNIIGCEFVKSSQSTFESSLGFYLLS
jgi:PilZ domain